MISALMLLLVAERGRNKQDAQYHQSRTAVLYAGADLGGQLGIADREGCF
jgi:hypothetical protein